MSTQDDRYQKAVALIDDSNRKDPNQVTDEYCKT